MKSKKTEEKIVEIDHWAIRNVPSIDKLKTENDFLDKAIEIANRIRIISLIVIGLVPERTASSGCYSQSDSTIVGNMVRAYKLYDTISWCVVDNRREIAAILTRVLLETNSMIRYLIKHEQSRKQYIKLTYNDMKIQYDDLINKEKERQLIPIEKRMKDRIERFLKEDGLNFDDIKNISSWRLDGKNIEQIIEDSFPSVAYNYPYRSSSIHVHGAWHDLTIYHLENEGVGYLPNPNYHNPDTRYLSPESINYLLVLKEFLVWNKSDVYNFVGPVIDNLLKLVILLDEKHEQFFHAEYETWKKR